MGNEMQLCNFLIKGMRSITQIFPRRYSWNRSENDSWNKCVFLVFLMSHETQMTRQHTIDVGDVLWRVYLQ